MRVQNNILLFCVCLLSGCASLDEYQTYVDAQKAVHRDYTMTELARISALTEIAKSATDPETRTQAVKALQEMNKPTLIERPKSWLER